jgi:hypothetical protein
VRLVTSRQNLLGKRAINQKLSGATYKLRKRPTGLWKPTRRMNQPRGRSPRSVKNSIGSRPVADRRNHRVRSPAYIQSVTCAGLPIPNGLICGACLRIEYDTLAVFGGWHRANRSMTVGGCSYRLNASDQIRHRCGAWHKVGGGSAHGHFSSSTRPSACLIKLPRALEVWSEAIYSARISSPR